MQGRVRQFWLNLLLLPPEKGIDSQNIKRKQYTLHEIKFFLFRVDPYTEGKCYAGKQAGSHKMYVPCTKWRRKIHTKKKTTH